MRFEFLSAPKELFFKSTPPIASGKSALNWDSWTWQMQNRLETQNEYACHFKLTPDEVEGFRDSENFFKISTTPYYASLALNCEPLRKVIMPTGQEKQAGTQEMPDPLGEVKNATAARLVHRYSDRVLFLVTDTCSIYCRYCLRKHFTGKDQGFLGSKDYEESLTYIKKHPGIREVILSGGDPLTLGNNVLDRILGDIRAIEHVEIIRIGSRMPVFCPQRIDLELCEILKKHKPVYVMSHINHPKELTAESVLGLTNLVDHGVPVYNQTVLLNGVNNHVHIIQALNRRLIYLRVKPYYLFQCDPSQGTDHLRTKIETGEAIQRELWGHLSGLAMANFSLDIPAGGGKTTLVPNFTTLNTPERREFVGWDGKSGEYLNPEGKEIPPADHEEYAREWNLLKAGKQEL